MLFLISLLIFTIKPGKAIILKSPLVPELNDTLVVYSDTTVDLPTLGNIKIRDMNINELRDTLNLLFQPYYQFPNIDVAIYNVVYVFGAVKKTGVYFLPEKATLSDLLALSGGPTSTADLRNTTVKTLDGRVKKVNLSKILRGKENTLTFTGGEVVYIPEVTLILRVTNLQTIVTLFALIWSVYRTIVQ